MIELLVDAAPDDVLLGSVKVLRQMGGRITRYDLEAQTLEALVPGRDATTIIQLTAAPHFDGRARLLIEDHGLGWWRRRRLRVGLGRLFPQQSREGDDQR
jgi:hypothetical protein